MNILIFATVFLGLGMLEDWFKGIDIRTRLINKEAHPFLSIIVWLAFAMALYGSARLGE